MQWFPQHQTFNIYRIWLENAYSQPQNGFSGRFDPVNGQHYQRQQ